MFLGFADIWIAIIYTSCFLVILVCVVYGVVNWNKDDDGEGVEE